MGGSLCEKPRSTGFRKLQVEHIHIVGGWCTPSLWGQKSCTWDPSIPHPVYNCIWPSICIFSCLLLAVGFGADDLTSLCLSYSISNLGSVESFGCWGWVLNEEIYIMCSVECPVCGKPTTTIIPDDAVRGPHRREISVTGCLWV